MSTLPVRYLRTESDDGTALRIARWGEENPHDVLIVHGLAEHAGRYTHVAQALVDAGWRVTLVELRGHGESEGRRGHIKIWHHYIEDVQIAASTVGRPFVLLCHSMGGLVGATALLEPSSPPCKAIAVSNPLWGIKADAPKLKIAAGRILSKILPWLPLDNEVETRLISRDPAVVAAYEADPLVFGTITPRWFTEMEGALADLVAKASTIQQPLRLMVSSADGICDADAAEALAERWGGPHETVRYEALYHEIFNEPEQAQVIGELVAWLETHK